MKFDLYSPRWHSDVIALADEVFGAGYFSRPTELAAESGSVIIIGQENDEELLCFARGRVLPENGLKDHLEGFVPEISPEIADADRTGALGVIQAIAVAPKSRRQGYGSKLVALLHDRLIGMGADKLIVTFKRGPNVPHVDGMMGKLGFET